MRLLLDATFMLSPGAFQLINELSQSIGTCVPCNCEAVMLMPAQDCEERTLGCLKIIPVEAKNYRWLHRRKWYNHLLPLMALEYEVDVVYSFSGFLSKSLVESFAVVSTVNNMLPFTPEMVRLIPRFSKTRLRNTLLRLFYVKSLKMADTVVLHSQHELSTLSKYTGDISAKTYVALSGVPRDIQQIKPEQLKHPYNGKRYFLYFSAIRPYKNHIRLIEAYHSILATEPDLPELLIAGIPSDKLYLESVLKFIRQHGLEDKVKYQGVFDRKDIPAWLYHADINLFPSLCEGNSLVLAEVLGLGGVLACSGIPPMSEVAGDAAEFFDPYATESIANVVMTLSHNQSRREDLRQRALHRATQLSWDECGKAIWTASQKALQAYQQRT